MKSFCVRRWFLVALVAVLFCGFYFAASLAPRLDSLPNHWRSWWVGTVMFLMALPLDASAMWQALRRPAPTLMGMGLNFGLAPLLAWAIFPLLVVVSRDLAFGLLIAAAVPSTVASAAVWTRRAGGNDAVSLMVTMATNVTCFVFTPLILFVTAGERVESERFEPVTMMLRLSLVVVAPVVLAQLARLLPRIGHWASRGKVVLGVLCQLGMLTMVFAGVVRSGDVLNGVGGERVSLWGWLVMIACVLFVHLATLIAAHLLGRAFHIPRPDRIAMGFSGSQKTLLVGLSIALDYAPAFGQLALLPMVAYHVSQLLVDTFIADRLREGGKHDTLGDEECLVSDI